MAAEIRICPNCGAGIVGNVENCPRCDYTLAVKTPAEPDFSMKETYIEDMFSTEMDDISRFQEEDSAPTLIEDSELPTEMDALNPPPIIPQDTHKNAPIEVEFENALTGVVPLGMIGASAPAYEDTQQSHVQQPANQTWQVPPAPYTPPPPIPEQTTSVEGYSYPSNHYLQQRVSVYQRGGYRLRSQNPYQVTLSYGKPLGFMWWLLALFSGVGALWYFLIMLTSGFSQDTVYILMERDGTLYEDGAGAAHVRRQRARVGRRWGLLGVILFFLSLIWFIGMVIGAAYMIENYRPELEAAYPTVTLFTSDEPPPDNLDAETVERAESGVLAFSILFILSALGVLSGLALTIVGYLHNRAYHVRVPPLPEYA